MFYVAEVIDGGLGKILARFDTEKEALAYHRAAEIDVHAFGASQNDWFDPKTWVAIEIWPDEDSRAEYADTEEEAVELYLENYKWRG